MIATDAPGAPLHCSWLLLRFHVIALFCFRFFFTITYIFLFFSNPKSLAVSFRRAWRGLSDPETGVFEWPKDPILPVFLSDLAKSCSGRKPEISLKNERDGWLHFSLKVECSPKTNACFVIPVVNRPSQQIFFSGPTVHSITYNRFLHTEIIQE